MKGPARATTGAGSSLVRGWVGLLRIAGWWAALVLAPISCLPGGPKYVAGVTYFNPGVVGQPAHWAGGRVHYYVD